MIDTSVAFAPARSRHLQLTGAASAFGTFGELLQGVLPEGDIDFLVTLPIRRGARVCVFLDPATTELTIRPAGKIKSLRLAHTMLRAYGYFGGGRITVDSDLPVGKGLASSSADLVATARAIATAMGRTIGPERIEALLRDIEPTDGVMYSGAVAFRHRQVRLHRRLGMLPPLTIVGLDEGGEIDTIQFNRRPKPFTETHKREYAHLLAEIEAAIVTGDAASIGRVATRSAQLNQHLHPKRTLDAAIDLCHAAGGLGVVTAHSGTAVGILLSPQDPDYPEQLELVRHGCAALSTAIWIDHARSRRLNELVGPIAGGG